MKDNNIVILELAKEDELDKFKKDLQESFGVVVIEEFGKLIHHALKNVIFIFILINVGLK